jgi:transcriptional regulator with XRE-family HTH domain
MLSKNIRFLRRRADISQEKLSQKLGYKSFTTIQKWEDGSSEPTVRTLNKLCEIFDVSMDEIVNSDLESKEYEPQSIAAHHVGEWTKEELEEIKQFKQWVRSKRK